MVSKEVQIGTNTILVKKLPLGAYAELLGLVDTILKKNSGLSEMDGDEFFNNVPQILSQSLPEVIEILSLCTDKDKKFLAEELDLDGTVELIGHIWEVNNFSAVFERAKKALTRGRNLPETITKT